MSDPAEHRVLVTGGLVRTMAAPAYADALAIRGDRVVQVGNRQACREALGGVDAEVDLAGRCLMPGFIDAHCHPLMLGQTLDWVDCHPERVSDMATLVTVLAEAAERLPAGAPVRGFGYEHRRLAEGRHPTRADLDRVATDREVHVMNASGHGGVVNSFALERYGITADTADPPGGRIGRDGAGHPDGQLWDAACDLLTGRAGIKLGNHGPNFHLHEPADALQTHLARAQETFLAAGVTTVCDAQVSQRELETYLRTRDSGGLRVRVSAYLISALLPEAAELGLVRPLGDEHMRVQGIKLYADGTLGGWTAYFPDGYAPDPCHHGQLYHDEAEFTELLVRAHRAGLQTATHAQSPHAIAMVLDAIEKAGTEMPRPHARHRIEHCGLPTDTEIARIADLGVYPVCQPQHHRRSGDATLTAVGELGHRYNPCGLFAAADIPFAFSSDAPVARPAPLEAVQAAAQRQTVSGTILGDSKLRLPVEQGLHAHTYGAATALGREHAVGSLEPGKLADFVVLDQDPAGVADSELATLPVRETWVGGTPVWPSQSTH